MLIEVNSVTLTTDDAIPLQLSEWLVTSWAPEEVQVLFDKLPLFFYLLHN